ncbi:hypothetical protein NDU88_002866 [Pleurodeles waltl]|uniref:Uncharacterized protein n=1 Tax=Pleurodeles waltl TaxID=8319 RepID=A0AAV7QA43_PLEWA|nr:hypothetical protein NDU88_002866 [Pleurodeles waltl]
MQPERHVISYWGVRMCVFKYTRPRVVLHGLGEDAVFRRAPEEKHRELEAKIKELEGRHGETGATEVRRQLVATRKQLKALDMDGVEHALLCTKHMYYVGGNKARRLLAHRLRAQVAQCQMNAIRAQCGAVINDE